MLRPPLKGFTLAISVRTTAITDVMTLCFTPVFLLFPALTPSNQLLTHSCDTTDTKLPLIFHQTFCEDESMRRSGTCLGWGEIRVLVSRSLPCGRSSSLSPGETDEWPERNVGKVNKQSSSVTSGSEMDQRQQNHTKPLQAQISTTSSKMADKKWMLNTCFQVLSNLNERATQRCLMLILVLLFENCWQVLWEEPHTDTLKQLWTVKFFQATWPQEIFCIWKLHEPEPR